MGSDRSTDPIRLTATVHGYVQGVGFRWSTMAMAESLNLVGFAENRYDGDVQVVAEGPRDACQKVLARIKAILRRTETPEDGGSAATHRDEDEPSALAVAFSAGEITLGSYSLDTRQQTLSFRNKTASLSTAEMCILHAFMTRAGIALSRDQLMSFAFGNDGHATARSVDVHISRLRALLRDLGDTSTRIRTVWGVGYCWLEE